MYLVKYTSYHDDDIPVIMTEVFEMYSDALSCAQDQEGNDPEIWPLYRDDVLEIIKHFEKEEE